jgi:hypothetical protein
MSAGLTDSREKIAKRLGIGKSSLGKIFAIIAERKVQNYAN